MYVAYFKYLVDEGLVILQPVCFVADQQIAGMLPLEPLSVQSECLIGQDEHLQPAVQPSTAYL